MTTIQVTQQTQSNKTTPTKIVNLTNTKVDNLIFYASILLPFINETAIVLTNSEIFLFNNLYKECIPDKIFKSLSIKDKQNMNIYNCSLYDTIRKISIDSLAYLGIILNIGRSTIKYGYITGVVNGFVIIICSIIFPNLYLGYIIDKLKTILNIKTSFMSIIIGLICIIILIFITKFFQDVSTKLFQNYRIDYINEPNVNNKIEQKIINFL